MITHVVMFKVKEPVSEVAAEIKARLMTLPPKIEQIKHYEVGINIVESARAYDLVLISKFADLDALRAYQVHPAHMQELQFIVANTSSIIAADYESE